MNNNLTGEAIAALQKLATRYPHWRVGQLIANIAGWAETTIWDLEDEQLITMIDEHCAQSSNSCSASLHDNITA